MWRLGFFFHEMGFGLLSIFLPLYVMSISGSLVAVGTLAAIAVLLAIPASFLWGYLCDKTRQYKIYVLISFLSAAVLLYVFTLTVSVTLLIVLYGVLSILHSAHEAPKNVLVAEWYSHHEWQKAFASYEGLTEAGWLLGLLFGFLASASGIGPSYTLIICAGLNLVGFVFALLFVADPEIMLERGLVNIEKSLDFAYRGIFLASQVIDGSPLNVKLKRENINAFGIGLILFSVATSILFTPMPVFVSSIVDKSALPAALVFAIFVVNSGGGIVGYFFVSRRSQDYSTGSRLGRTVMFRCFLAFLLLANLQFAVVSVPLTTLILFLMGLAYAIFLVQTLSLSMELVPSGKSGMFNVLIGIGSAIGSFTGPFIAQTFGFGYVFLIGGVVFCFAYVFFRIFT